MENAKPFARLAMTLALAGCLAAASASNAAEAPSLFDLGPGAALSKQNAAAFTVQRRNLQFRNGPDAAEVFTLDLFGRKARAERTRFVRHSPTHYEWFGRLAGEEGSFVMFVGHGGTVVGKVETGSRLYEIKLATPTAYVIDEVDAGSLRANVNKDGNDFIPNPAPPPALAKGSAAGAAAGKVIDVMVLYNQTCLNRRPDIVAFIHTLIAEANDAYVRSGIDQSVRLVHQQRYEKGYDSASREDLDLARQDPEILRLRKVYGADIAHVLVPETNATGNSGLAYTDDPVAFTTLAYAQSLRTFTHEMGHNMGALHAREQYPNPQGYNYGLRNPGKKFITIMAYFLDCNDCQLINNFSNPDIWFNGAPTGIAEQADNARTLREHTARVAAFMSDAYALSVEKTGNGRIKSDLAGIDCGSDCSENWYKPEIRTVTLSAVPDAGWLFKGWNGACSGTANCVLRMDDDRKAGALFELDPGNLTVALWDVQAKRDVSPLEGTAYLRRDTLPSQVTVQARLKSAAGSVRFELSGPQIRTFTANGAPFTLFGSLAGQPIAWSPVPTGRFNLTVSAFSGPDGSGTQLAVKRLVLDVKSPATGLLAAAPLTAVRATPGGFRLALAEAAWLEVSLRGLDGREVLLRRGTFPAGEHAFDRSAFPSLEAGAWLLRVSGAHGPLYRKLHHLP